MFPVCEWDGWMSYFLLYSSTCNPFPPTVHLTFSLNISLMSPPLTGPIWKLTLSKGPLEMALRSFKVRITTSALNGFTTYHQHSVGHAFSFDALKKVGSVGAQCCPPFCCRPRDTEEKTVALLWLWRCGLTGVSCLTVQETSRGDYPGPPPLGPCRLLMTWTTENLLLLLIMVSQTCHFPSLSIFFVMLLVFKLPSTITQYI